MAIRARRTRTSARFRTLGERLSAGLRCDDPLEGCVALALLHGYQFVDLKVEPWVCSQLPVGL